MRPVALALLTALSLGLSAATPPRRTRAAAVAPAPMRVMTYNLRYDNPADGPDAWPKRKEAIVSAIRFHHADLLCIQEGLAHQVAYLAESLGWTAFGVGRDDGKKAGEFAAILFDPMRFTQLDGGHFWLSPSPERPGPGWDAASIRIATWARLKDRSGRAFLALNTHLDDQGAQARREGARLIAERLRRLGRGLPVLVTGDFNTGPDSEVCTTLREAGLLDAFTRSERPPHGPFRTYWGFDPAHPDRVEGDRIDFVFVSKDLRVKAHGTLVDLTATGHFPSDHLPVVADLELPRR